MFIRLDRVPVCDGRTDRQTELLYVLQRSALHAMRPRCKNAMNRGSYLEMYYCNMVEWF